MPKADRDEFVYCELCHGRGKYKENPCPACRGVGKVFTVGRSWVYCELCHGRGKYKDGACPACYGVGKAFSD